MCIIFGIVASVLIIAAVAVVPTAIVLTKESDKSTTSEEISSTKKGV
jgi:hypothetical protein